LRAERATLRRICQKWPIEAIADFSRAGRSMVECVALHSAVTPWKLVNIGEVRVIIVWDGIEAGRDHCCDHGLISTWM